MTSRTVAPSQTPAGGDVHLPGWRAPLLFFVVMLVAFGLTSGGVSSSDDQASAVEGWRLATTGSPWLEDVAEGLDENPWLHEVPNGHVVADRMIGPALICVPFYWLADSGSSAGDFSRAPAGYAAATTTAVTALLMFLALRRRLGDRLGALCAGAFALSTPTWSVSADGPWTHTLTQLGLAGAAYGASRDRWWVVGVFLGVGMFGRPHLAVVAAVLGLGMAWSRRSLSPAARVAVPSLAALGLLLICNRLLFGVWAVTSSGYVGHSEALMTGAVSGDSSGTAHYTYFEGIAGFLFSPARGLLVWTPLLLVLAPAVLRSWRVVPEWTRFLAIGGVAYSLVQLRLNYFGGGTFFYGYRLALELLTCLVPLVAFALRRASVRVHRLTVALAVLQLGAIFLGAVTEGGFIDADRVWQDNALSQAWRNQPVMISVWMAVWLSMGVLAAHRLVNKRAA